MMAWLRPLPRLALLLAAMALHGAEPMVVIVHSESGIQRMSRAEATNIFMGRQKRLASGLLAVPVEQGLPEEALNRFYLYLVGLPQATVRAYWARLLFSGKAQPPRRAHSAEEVVEFVATNKGAVGVIEQRSLSPRVRSVLILEDPLEPRR